MLLDTIFKKLPDGVLCRELKLLYVSGRLFEAFQMRDINKMPLTTIEKMFLKWAMRQWKKSEDAKKYAHNREEFKHWATKLAITGQDEVIESGVINSNPYIPYIPPPIRANVGTVGVALQNTTGKTTCSKVFQSSEEHNRQRRKTEDVK